MYRYRIKSTGHSSRRFGVCEVCGGHCAEVKAYDREHAEERFWDLGDPSDDGWKVLKVDLLKGDRR